VRTQSRSKKAIRLSVMGLAIGLAAELGLGAVVATAASASPTNCQVKAEYTVPGRGLARCLGGSGYSRVVVGCSATPTSTSIGRYYGPWVGVSTTWSAKVCPSDRRFLRLVLLQGN
jgi:hypothetical protein